MKLKKVGTFTTSSGKSYHRFDVTLPRKLIDELGWAEGDELEAVQHKDGILLRPANRD